MTIADRRADRQRRPVDRPRHVLVIEIYQPYPARLRFQMQQGRKGLAGSRPVDVMAVLQSEAEPVRQRCLPVNGSAMRQSRVTLTADTTAPAGQSREPRSQESALVVMAANYRHIGGAKNRLGPHYSRFSQCWSAVSLPLNHLLYGKSRDRARL
jgi:hypothetical protein